MVYRQKRFHFCRFYLLFKDVGNLMHACSKILFKYAFKIFVCFESLDLITQFFVGKIFFMA